MFSFQKNKRSSDELVFHQIPSSISFQQQAARSYQQEAAADLLVVELHDHHVTMEAAINSNTNNSVIAKARKRHGDQSPNSSSKPNSANTTTDPPQADQGVVDQDDQYRQRKLAHRETERQRRQDMSKLYASLRGLLPLEFVKGRRSTSDHMHQAVKYIKHMQENLRLLSLKRDQLKKFVETSTTSFLPPAAAAAAGAGVHHDCTNTTNEEKRSLLTRNLNTVSISSSCCNNNNNSRPEIQILINSCLIEDGFPLSGVLKAISEQGLCVITCTSTKLNGRLFHTIQSQLQLHLQQKKTPNQLANDDHPVQLPPTDLSVLQQRLTAVANNY